MKKQILDRIARQFDKPVMQNDLRGLYVEAMIAELLGPGWTFTGGDWSGWDFENEAGTRIEVKQSAKGQTWGKAKSSPRFSIAAARGHYPDGVNYIKNDTGDRLADFYIFAWHEGMDQREVEQWQFFVVPTRELPKDQKSIGLAGVIKLVDPVSASDVRLALTLR